MTNIFAIFQFSFFHFKPFSNLLPQELDVCERWKGEASILAIGEAEFPYCG